jgi:hypothetical protein
MLSPACRVTPTAEARSMTHRDEDRGQVRPAPCRLQAVGSDCQSAPEAAQILHFGRAPDRVT